MTLRFRLPGETFSMAPGLTGLLAQPMEVRLVQSPLNTSTTGLKFPIGLTMTVSLGVSDGPNRNQTSLAVVDAIPPHATGARLWVAPAVEKV